MGRVSVEGALKRLEKCTPGRIAWHHVLPLQSLGSKGYTVALSVVSDSLHPCLSESWGFVACGRCMAGGTLPGTGWKGWKESCPQLHTRLVWLIPPTPGLTSVIALGVGMDICVLAFLPFLPFNLVDRLISELSVVCQGHCGQQNHLGWWLSWHLSLMHVGVLHLFNPWVLWAHLVLFTKLLWLTQISFWHLDGTEIWKWAWGVVENIIGFPPCLWLLTVCYLTLQPVEDILEISFLKKFHKSSFLSFLYKESEPVLIALGQLGSWDISANTGGSGNGGVHRSCWNISYHMLPWTKTLGKCLGTPNHI